MISLAVGVTTAITIIVTYDAYLKDIVRPMFINSLPFAPMDKRFAKVSILNDTALSAVFDGKRILVVGGSRGVGRGTALALADGGADVAVLGRSQKSGEKIVDELEHRSKRDGQLFQYIQGDLSCNREAAAAVDNIQAYVKINGKFDGLVVTAAVFPDWEASSLLQEDGFDKAFAVAVNGRFMIYNAIKDILKQEEKVGPGRQASSVSAVVNVMAPGQVPMAPFDRSLAKGDSCVKTLVESLGFISLGNDLMLIALQDHLSESTGAIPMVSTHPGLLKTDLHRNQGVLFDLVEEVGVRLFGYSEEEAGRRQASVLAAAMTRHLVPQGVGPAPADIDIDSSSGSFCDNSDKRCSTPKPDYLLYVDPELQVRVRSVELQKEVDKHNDWLWKEILQPLVQKPASRQEQQL